MRKVWRDGGVGLLRRLAARRCRGRGGRCRRVAVGATAVEPGRLAPRERGAGGRHESGGARRERAVGRDEADAARLAHQQLQDVVDDVAGTGAPLGQVGLVQQAQGLACKGKGN